MTSQAAAVMNESSDLDYKNMANAIRALSMDMVQRANSGHPGMPMGMADVATVLFSRFLKFDPKNPDWADRDRFIMSGGHGSALLYSLLYLTGYEDMTIEQIKNFRQMGSLTPGHPESTHTKGVEMTTGPLGQGLASAPGFALAERRMNDRFGDKLASHYTYIMCGDGDLMEGISHEGCALAGHLKLSKMIVLYDDNGICIDGSTDLVFTENTQERFEAYGWDVQEIDGHNPAEIQAAIAQAQGTDTPSLICCKTHIGFGAPTKQGTSGAHGAPLGEDEIKGARENLGWAHAPFDVPDDILSQWRSIGARGAEDRAAWEGRLDGSADKAAFTQMISGNVTSRITPVIAELKTMFAEEKPKKATRQTSGMCLEKLVPALDEMVGGSADLTGSNNTKVAASTILDAENYGGNYINYGVREHGMAAIMNGMAQHGGVVPYAGTFMQFADYSRPAIRLGALMKQRVIHVMTHDSIGLGEDGPTHQPVEHMAALRAIPNLNTFRPCDGVETAECWEIALNSAETPSIMALTRQGLPTVREATTENLCMKGAYILSDCEGAPDVTIFASGSEIELALAAKEQLSGQAVRVISVPCMELFIAQDGEYQASLMCNDSIKVAIEAGIRQGWDRLIGPHGAFIGMDSFGESAPASDLFKHFGITVEAVVEAVKKKQK